MARKDQSIADLLKMMGVLKDAPNKWPEGWSVARIRSVLEEELKKMHNELYEFHQKDR
jgi:hypothetical protein